MDFRFGSCFSVSTLINLGSAGWVSLLSGLRKFTVKYGPTYFKSYGIPPLLQTNLILLWMNFLPCFRQIWVLICPAVTSFCWLSYKSTYVGIMLLTDLSNLLPQDWFYQSNTSPYIFFNCVFPSKYIELDLGFDFQLEFFIPFLRWDGV